MIECFRAQYLIPHSKNPSFNNYYSLLFLSKTINIKNVKLRLLSYQKFKNYNFCLVLNINLIELPST